MRINKHMVQTIMLCCMIVSTIQAQNLVVEGNSKNKGNVYLKKEIITTINIDYVNDKNVAVKQDIFIPSDGGHILRNLSTNTLMPKHFIAPTGRIKSIFAIKGERTNVCSIDLRRFGKCDELLSHFSYLEPGKYSVVVQFYLNAKADGDLSSATALKSNEYIFDVVEPQGKDKETYDKLTEADRMYFKNSDRAREIYHQIVDDNPAGPYAFTAAWRSRIMLSCDPDLQKRVDEIIYVIDNFPDWQYVNGEMGGIAFTYRNEPDKVRSIIENIAKKHADSPLIQERAKDILNKLNDGHYKKIVDREKRMLSKKKKIK